MVDGIRCFTATESIEHDWLIGKGGGVDITGWSTAAQDSQPFGKSWRLMPEERVHKAKRAKRRSQVAAGGRPSELAKDQSIQRHNQAPFTLSPNPIRSN